MMELIDLSKAVKENGRYIIFGAGIAGHKIAWYLKTYVKGCNICFCDNNPQKQDRHATPPVYSLEECRTLEAVFLVGFDGNDCDKLHSVEKCLVQNNIRTDKCFWIDMELFDKSLAPRYALRFKAMEEEQKVIPNEKPLVSILIPVYNRVELVKKAVSSALKQTYPNIEIIVADNHSTDGTYEELLRVFGKNEKVRIFCNDKNIGPVGNWKVCMQHARGKYVKFLFSDDLISEKFVEKCVIALEGDSAIGMVYSACRLFSEEVPEICRELHRLYVPTGKYAKELFYWGTYAGLIDVLVSPGCALFRREDVNILTEIPNNQGVVCNRTGAGIDLLIYLHTLKKYEYFYYIDEQLAQFRYHQGSFSISENLEKEYNLAKQYFYSVNEADLYNLGVNI